MPRSKYGEGFKVPVKAKAFEDLYRIIFHVHIRSFEQKESFSFYFYHNMVCMPVIFTINLYFQ